MDGSILIAQSPAPDGYYQNNFQNVFQFVVERLEGIVSDKIIQGLKTYLDASDDAQRLFARLLTRKGPTFLINSLNYTEINDLPGAVNELCKQELLQLSPHVRAEEILGKLKKEHIVEYFAIPKQLAKTSKTRLLEHLLGTKSDRQICDLCRGKTQWLRIANPTHWHLISTLYFGSTAQDWSTFVRRDLGLLSYENVALETIQFASREKLLEYLDERNYANLIYRLDEYPKLLSPLLALLVNTQGAKDMAKNSIRLRQRSLLRLGKWCERNKALDAALLAYANCQVVPARERQVRILTKQGKSGKAAVLLKEIIEAPSAASERVFAQRFGKRGAGYQPLTTIMNIHEVPDSVEDYVLLELIKDGGWGMHSENFMLKTLTGLIYWPICFLPLPGAFTNPFQSGPQDLYERDFFLHRKTAFELLEASLENETEFIKHIKKIAKEKKGIANRLVSWSLLDSVNIDEWLDSIPILQLRELSKFLIRNLADYRRGFPDLFICHGLDNVEYVEVKGPNDQLQPQQRAWFEEFHRMNIPARVVKLQLVK